MVGWNRFTLLVIILLLFLQFSLSNQQGKLISYSDDKDATLLRDQDGNLTLFYFPRIFFLFHRDRGAGSQSESYKDGVSNHRVVATLGKINRRVESPAARKFCQQETDFSAGLAAPHLF